MESRDTTPKTGPLVGRVRLADILPVASISRATVYRLRAAGRFPAAVQMPGGRIALYDADQVNEWLRNPAGYRAGGAA